MSRRYDQILMGRLYGLFHYIALTIYDICFRGEIAGLENIPRQGAFIVACNHASHLDPPIVGSQVPRQMAFFARKTLWKPGIASWWLDGVGTIPVDRDGGSDVAAIRRVLQTLQSGKALILFPEGTRSLDGNLQPAKAGVGLIACKTQAPVLPARIFNSHHAFGKSGGIKPGVRVSVAFGPLISPADYDDPSAGRERYQKASEHIMSAIARLQEPRYAVI
ncbi:MAG TPA: lysophospholipid acyltransferase family protein [Opitutaceae bacterium]|nr:lysophospholipid acyltransferase family protein [Opitutaceae bacterium]